MGGGGGGGGHVRLCPVLFGFYETTDVFFGTLADINGHWPSRTDIGGLRRTLTDKDGHWWTWTDIGGLGRTRVAKGRPAFRDRITKGNPCPPMSCPFLDSIRQRTCFLVH